MIKYLLAFTSIIIFSLCMFCSIKNPTATDLDKNQYVEMIDAINDLYTNDTLDTMCYNLIDIKRVGISSNDNELICTLVVAGFPDTLWLNNTSLYGDTLHDAPHWGIIFDFWSTPLTDEDIFIDIYFHWGSEGWPDYLTTLESNYSAKVCLWMDTDNNNNFDSKGCIPARFYQLDSMLVIHYSDPAVVELEKNILHSDIYIVSFFRNKRDEISREK